MTKKEIVKRIAEDTALTQITVAEVVQRTLDAIMEAVVRNGRIELRNFGVLEVRHRRRHLARNPRTGAHVEVPAKNIVCFRAGRALAERARKGERS